MDDFLKIHEYADNALEGEERSNVEKLLAESEKHRREYLAVLQIKLLLKEKLPAVDSKQTDAAWEKCQNRIHELKKVLQSERFITRFSPALAACIMFVILAGAYFYRTSPSSHPSSQIAHLMSASSAGLPSFRPSNPNLTETWVKERLGKPVELPSLRRHRLTPVLAEVIRCNGKPCAVRVTFTDYISDYYLLILPKEENLTEGLQIEGYPGVRYLQIGRMNAVSWISGETRMILIASQPVSVLLSMLK
ncbi:MAG TPA: hypothetical protein VNK96_02410 [Fimbriimonadales bacterium]|nr:hypothetical protein [Fimbriimonadales bacterium]